MKILGIDTSSRYLSLGAWDGSKIYEYNLDLGIRHSSLLVPTIKRVTQALGWDVADIDYFACGLGPGSFTGIRVGMATIKGLGWALRKPLVGISSLDILALNAKAAQGWVVPVIDAKRDLIYCSIYKADAGSLKRRSAYMLLSREELLKKIRPKAIILGDAVALYKEEIFKAVKGAVFLNKDCWYPKGHCIIELALERIRAKKLNNAFDIQPIYLYPKECQIRKL